MLFVCIESYTAITMSNFRTFSSAPCWKKKKKTTPHPRQQSVFVPPSAQSLTTANLLSVCLFDWSMLGISYKQNCIKCDLYIWLISLSLVFSRFIHIMAYICTLFIYFAITEFVYPFNTICLFIYQLILGLFPFQVYYE